MLWAASDVGRCRTVLRCGRGEILGIRTDDIPGSWPCIWERPQYTNADADTDTDKTCVKYRQQTALAMAAMRPRGPLVPYARKLNVRGDHVVCPVQPLGAGECTDSDKE